MSNEHVIVNAMTCPNCKWTIFSRAGHDMHSCDCGGISIDGGFSYIRAAWRPDIVPEPPPSFKLRVNATKRDLYDDWNHRKNKFGKLPPEAILMVEQEPEGDVVER
jgi:hypothetical protein